MENHNYSVLDMNGSEAAFQQVDKDRGKNAKQFTWVLLLKAHRAVGSIAWLGNGLWTLLGVIKNRLIFGQGVTMENEKSNKGRFLFESF
ncbi:putative xyloglucan glycosyltransferase 5 [Quercus suber]|uniref:Xyloglucan glycosyltransferase 5 n=1 Tax=Quercus suber TaxID=58331 RepID=A0AAW0LXJ9_QUESU